MRRSDGARVIHALRLHADDLGVGVLGDLADQRAAVGVGHPVPRFEPLVASEDLVEVRLQLSRHCPSGHSLATRVSS